MREPLCSLGSPGAGGWVSAPALQLWTSSAGKQEHLVAFPKGLGLGSCPNSVSMSACRTLPKPKHPSWLAANIPAAHPAACAQLSAKTPSSPRTPDARGGTLGTGEHRARLRALPLPRDRSPHRIRCPRSPAAAARPSPSRPPLVATAAVSCREHP